MGQHSKKADEKTFPSKSGDLMAGRGPFEPFVEPAPKPEPKKD